MRVLSIITMNTMFIVFMKNLNVTFMSSLYIIITIMSFIIIKGLVCLGDKRHFIGIFPRSHNHLIGGNHSGLVEDGRKRLVIRNGCSSDWLSGGGQLHGSVHGAERLGQGGEGMGGGGFGERLTRSCGKYSGGR